MDDKLNKEKYIEQKYIEQKNIEQKNTEIANTIRYHNLLCIKIDNDDSVNKIYDLIYNNKYFEPTSIIEYIYHIYYSSFPKSLSLYDQNIVKNITSNMSHIIEKLEDTLKIDTTNSDLYLVIGIYYYYSIREYGCHRKDYEEKMVYHITQSTIFGNMYASYLLGLYYSGFKYSEKKTLTLLLQAANTGSIPEAMYKYSSLCTNIRDRYNYTNFSSLTVEQHIEHYKYALKCGVIGSCHCLADIYKMDGEYAKSIKCYTKGIGYGCHTCLESLKQNINITDSSIRSANNGDIFVLCLMKIYQNGTIHGKRVIINEFIAIIERSYWSNEIILSEMHKKYIQQKRCMRKSKITRLKVTTIINKIISLCKTAISENICITPVSYILGIIYSDNDTNLASHYYNMFIDGASNYIHNGNDIKIMITNFCEKINDTTLIDKYMNPKKNDF